MLSYPSPSLWLVFDCSLCNVLSAARDAGPVDIQIDATDVECVILGSNTLGPCAVGTITQSQRSIKILTHKSRIILPPCVPIPGAFSCWNSNVVRE